MSLQIFKKLRKPGFATTFIVGMLSNVVVFADPVSRVINNYGLESHRTVYPYYSTDSAMGDREVHGTLPAKAYSPFAENRIAPSISEPISLSHKNREKVTGESERKKNTTPKNQFSPTLDPHILEEFLVFHAQEEQGAIGVSEAYRSDNGRDNYFTMTLPEAIDFSDYTPVLAYELYGLSEGGGTTKSINGGTAYGGSAMEKDSIWKSVEEYLPVALLRKGKNEVFFNRRTDGDYGYQVRNISIKLYKTQNPEMGKSKKEVIATIAADGPLASKTFSLENMGETPEAPFGALSLAAVMVDSAATGGVATVWGLPFKDVKPLDQELVNVTSGNFEGYRVGFSEAILTPLRLNLDYDPEKIPEGYTVKDVKTYYYDRQDRSWKAMPVDAVDLDKNTLTSTITDPGGETDYINGIIKVPEQAETSNFVPTTLKDIEFANPSAGVVSIAPPTPNNMGAVTTSFPIKLPAGRQGMQPSLEVNYNSEGGNGWMGMGWDLSIPSIALNTKWGVPIFDGDMETELYSMSGQDLVLELPNNGGFTNPHRDDSIYRETDRHFYLRKEGSYLEIMRHGSSPTNYMWEVTDKYGNKSFYGWDGEIQNPSTNHVLRDNIEDTGNITHWALARQQDASGNYVDYEYDKEWVTVDGISGWEYYVQTITYTLHEAAANNHYTVQFGREPGRTDIMTSARNGVFQITKDLLSEITISFVQGGAPQIIRTYKFEYEDGSFLKKRLMEISEFDSGGTLFYSNTMEYFDEIGTGSAIISNTVETWDGSSDDISSLLHTLATGDLSDNIPKGSALGTGVSSGSSTGVRVGFGIGLNAASVANTIGGSFSYTNNRQDTRISFIDINGDGLPDKVYEKNGDVQYRPNNGTEFGGLVPISGLGGLSESKSRTIGLGVDANLFGLIGAGKSKSKTKTETDNYFVDFNGDGLPDIINNNRVKFNTTQPNGDHSMRAFEGNVGLSENPILSGPIDLELFEHLELETLEELREQHPQFDHVKVWRAPYDGEVTISNQATLVHINNDGTNANDDFRLTIERGEHDQTSGTTYQIWTHILTNPINYTTPDPIEVDKGDLVFFRIHNKTYGYGGEVEWSPVILYTSGVPAHQDENGKQLDLYDAEEDFMLNNDNGWSPHSGDTSVSIDFNLDDQDFGPYQFTDDIKFIIEKTRIIDTIQQVEETWVRTYNHQPGTFSGDGTNPISTSVDTTSGHNYAFNFYVESSSNVAWDAIGWKPQISGTESGTNYPGINYHTYDGNVNQSNYWIDSPDLIYPVINDTIPNDGNKPFLVLEHDMFSQNYANFLDFLGDYQPDEPPLKINWAVKEKTGDTVKVAHLRTFYLFRTSPWTYMFTKEPQNDPIHEIDPLVDADYLKHTFTKAQIKAIKDADGTIYSAFYVGLEAFGDGNGADISLGLHPDEQPNYTFTPKILDKPFMAISPAFYGLPYRGWGQFLYNGGLSFDYNEDGEITNPDTPEIYDGPIDMAVFQQSDPDIDPEGLQNDIDEMNTSDTTALNNIDLNGQAIRYTFYKQDNASNRYENKAIIDAVYGYNNDTLTATVGRFGEGNLYDIYLDEQELIDGTSGAFAGFKQRMESKGKAISGQLLIVTGTDSESTTNVLNQYLDLNGDRYPDIVTKGRVQFTDMRGALSTTTSGNDFVSGGKNEDITVGVTIASMKANSDQDKYVENPVKTNAFAGINGGDGETFDARQWADMNGDGLPDKVKIGQSSVKVWLNTGYGFIEEELVWGSGYNGLLASERFNLGIGVPLGTASVAVGLGGGVGTAHIKSSLVDVNGDGLPDLVIESGDTYNYYLNTGTGFDTTLRPFYGGDTLEKDVNVSGSIYAAFTGGFVFSLWAISFKVTFSPSNSINAGFNEKTATVGDIDGDGLPDVLYKSNALNNTALSAKLNRVGKTHLLKKVNTPLGGSWEVGYARMGNSYEMPQSKWVMDTLTTDDGFTGDSPFGPDRTFTTFAYENGNHDRRERDFFGFETVRTEQRDPDGASVYRYTEKKYHNQNYYLKGALKESATYTAAGDALSRNRNFYNLMKPDGFTANFNTDLDEPYIESGVGELDRTRIFPALVKTITTSYEAGQALHMVREFKVYDAFGNITEHIDQGSGPSDAFRAVIGYDINFRGLPTSIKVLENSGGTLMRHREATYTPQAKLHEITTHLDASDPNSTNTVSFKYDGFGNTIAVEQLDNLSSTGSGHFTLNMEYDNILHTYPVEMSDSYGQTSTRVYNYWFGAPVLMTDINGNSMRTRIDNRGRVIEIAGPNEYDLPNGEDWIIRKQYEGEDPVEQHTNGSGQNDYMFDSAEGNFQAADPDDPDPVTTAQHHAVTRHKDPHILGNEFLTVSIVDGFGQAIQLKKKHYVDGTTAVWQVSGKEIKDDYGRVVKKYLPTSQTYDPQDMDYYDEEGSNPILVEYDVRDRQTDIQQPDTQGSTTLDYAIASGMFLTTVTNELNQTQETYTDLRGRQRKVIQNGEITTEFFYNIVNEQVKVKNHQGYETKYTYDLAGRRTQEQHPDRGTTNYTYDNAGRLVKKQTANLLQPNNVGVIEYEHNYGRLQEVVYPHHPENNVSYTYGTALSIGPDNNTVGRLMQQEDATGIQRFEYGKMGELTRSLRAVAVAGKKSYWFNTRWSYDSWNRVDSITYPDNELVTYHYDPAGQLSSMKSNINQLIGSGGPSMIVSHIRYTDYGERSQIKYGNSTVTNYEYDVRRRMDNLRHVFPGFQAEREYVYDELSNITAIVASTDPGTGPDTGVLGGPVQHNYTYDDYNRLMTATGHYVGPNDHVDNLPNNILRQAYSLNMTYDNAHNILKKHQVHQFAGVASISETLPTNAAHAPATSYKLEYGEYATGAHSADGQGYVQPHAPRTITEYPNENYGGDPTDPRIKRKIIDYDADGNQLEIRERVSDPEEPLGYREETVRKHLWDEENRLRAVDLYPEGDEDKPQVAVYTYDAGGERIIKYVPGRLDARYSAKVAGSADRLEAIIYPSPLLTAKTLALPEDTGKLDEVMLTKYTKHYYMGSERVASALGTLRSVGLLCEQLGMPPQATVTLMDQKVQEAGTALIADHATLDKVLALPSPFLYGTKSFNCGRHERTGDYAAYWYHPDHLGSSSYITSLKGLITQHMEYLPFGETLAEEHLNSNNSPYKFNAKELDAETGNYYYGARYYSPKYNLMLSVDPAYSLYPGFSPYAYTLQNPVKFVDPTGMWPIIPRPLRAFGNYVENKVESGMRSVSNTMDKIGESIAAPFYALSNAVKNGGGYVFAGDSTKSSISNTPDRKANGDAETYNVQVVMELSDVYAPIIDNKLMEGANIAKDLVETFGPQPENNYTNGACVINCTSEISTKSKDTTITVNSNELYDLPLGLTGYSRVTQGREKNVSVPNNQPSIDSAQNVANDREANLHRISDETIKAASNSQ